MSRSARAQDPSTQPISTPPALSGHPPDREPANPTNVTAAPRALAAGWDYPSSTAAKRRQVILRANLQPRHTIAPPHPGAHPEGPRRPFQRAWL